MTSQDLPLDNGILAIPKRNSLVVEVTELPLNSPTQELAPAPASCHGLVEILGKMEGAQLDASRAWMDGSNLKRPQTGDGHKSWRNSRSRGRRTSSVGSMDSTVGDSHSRGHIERPTMQLPAFEDYSRPSFLLEQNNLQQRLRSDDGLQQSSIDDVARFSYGVHAESTRLSHTQSWPLPSHMDASYFHYPSRIQPLLTPPEDIDAFKWDTVVQADTADSISTVPANEPGAGGGGLTQEQSRSQANTRPSEIQLPAPSNMSSDESNMPLWLGRACQKLVSSLGDPTKQQNIQMVVQALPPQAKKAGVKLVFEKVVEVLQAHFTLPPYITITHAVSQVISMDEVPASPPATPNTHHSSDGYFEDQTIFTHAAVVPAYHAQSTVSTIVSPRPSNIIAAPSSIQMTILERYIPPTTAQEIHDFFTMSRKSYLADRLLELSANDGSLLLVFPTKTGGMTFAKSYIGPIIEPFLRQFVLLNHLFVDIAVDLGRMASLDSMKEFEELRDAVGQMCHALSQRAPARGVQSRYEVVHAETADVALNRNVWREWFLEQETTRLRQNLVDYHKAGGRMPSRVGQIETTPGMLAREVVDGIRTSREPAGEVGIEVGVFVIRRSIV